MLNLIGCLENLGGPLKLGNLANVVPMTCIFCLPVKFDLCTDGLNLEINSSKLCDINTLANSCILDMKTHASQDKYSATADYKPEVYVKHYKVGNLHAFTLDISAIWKFLNQEIIYSVPNDMTGRQNAWATEQVRHKLSIACFWKTTYARQNCAKMNQDQIVISAFCQGSYLFPEIYRGTQCTSKALAAMIYVKLKWDLELRLSIQTLLRITCSIKRCGIKSW